jgi:hypothetical protein
LILALAAWFTCVVSWRVTTDLLLTMAANGEGEEAARERRIGELMVA